MDVEQVWHALENHGLKLPVYIIKLLLCTGYDNLQSLSKLTTNQLIEELEAYATENLDTFDLGLSETEAKYYFSRRTSKFNILPGHKHLIIAAAETAMKLLLQQQSAEHPEHETESEFEKIPDEHDQSSLDDDKSMNHNGLHFLSEFSTLGNRANSRTQKSDVSLDSVISVEEEQHSLVEFLKTWIARKVLSGLLEPFLFDVDYKVQVYRPKSSNQQTSRSDVYSFVCLRCNTTIRAFKRPNGQNWNAANVCRHISTVHFLKPPMKTQHKVNNQQQRSTYLVSSLSTPPLSDSPIEQDPLD